jgi:hypothetical protein
MLRRAFRLLTFNPAPPRPTPRPPSPPNPSPAPIPGPIVSRNLSSLTVKQIRILLNSQTTNSSLSAFYSSLLPKLPKFTLVTCLEVSSSISRIHRESPLSENEVSQWSELLSAGFQQIDWSYRESLTLLIAQNDSFNPDSEMKRLTKFLSNMTRLKISDSLATQVYRGFKRLESQQGSSLETFDLSIRLLHSFRKAKKVHSLRIGASDLKNVHSNQEHLKCLPSNSLKMIARVAGFLSDNELLEWLKSGVKEEPKKIQLLERIFNETSNQRKEIINDEL